MADASVFAPALLPDTMPCVAMLPGPTQPAEAKAAAPPLPHLGHPERPPKSLT